MSTGHDLVFSFLNEAPFPPRKCNFLSRASVRANRPKLGFKKCVKSNVRLQCGQKNGEGLAGVQTRPSCQICDVQ